MIGLGIFALIYAGIALVPAIAAFTIARGAFESRYAPHIGTAVFLVVWIGLVVGFVLNPPDF